MIKNSIKIKNLKLKIYLLLATCCLVLISAPSTNAVALSLSIDPPIIIIKAIPPTTIVSSLTVQNKSDTEIPLRIQLNSFKAKGENARPPARQQLRSFGRAGEVGRGEPEYLNEVSPIIKNIQILDAGVPVGNITLSPHQQKNLNLSINIPQDSNTSGGRDYYFSVIFVSTAIPPVESSSSINQIGIAANVLLSVGHLETPKAVLEEFSSDTFFAKGPVPFTIRIRNTGTHFIKPKGEITIKNMFGQNIGKLDLSSVNILSDSIRSIPAALWKENFLLGLYTATLNISMSDEGPVFTRTVHFLAFPFQASIIIMVIVIAVIIIRNRLKLYMNKDRT